MAKIMIAAAIMIAFLALAEASSFRATITSLVEEDENQGGGQSQQRCRRQIRQQFEQLRHCQQYLSQGSPFEMDIMNQQGRQQQHLRQCCQALQNFDEKCQCEAVRAAVRRQQQQGGSWQGQGGQEMQQVKQKALSAATMETCAGACKNLDKLSSETLQPGRQKIRRCLRLVLG